MQSVLHLILNVVFFVNVIVGMALNGFMVLMNCKTWSSKKCLPTGDTIVTSLCLSRWIFQCLLAVHHSLHLLLPGEDLTIFFTPARILLNYISIWLASLLCVYYCVKITNYKHVVFLYLKARMSKLVPWCLGLSVFLSLVFSLPFGCLYFSPQYKAVTADIFQNMTKKPMERQYLYFIGSSPALVLFGIAFFLTVPSLWRHIRNMSGVGTSFRNPEMKTHYNAIKSMAAFFLLHSLFITSINVYFSGVIETGSPYILLLSIVSASYPCLHSGVIIFYNRKLREGFLVPMTLLLSFVRRK